MKILTIDGIIYSLQRNGGISVYFNELQQRLQNNRILYELVKTNSKLKRYINPRMSDNRIFHSSYYRTARGKNIINITTVYDFTYEFFASGIKKIVHSRQKFNAIKNSECIICISENTKNDLLNFLPDIDSNKIYVTPLGPSSLFHPLHLENKSECPYILFVGARGGYKNFRNLVLALSMLKDINLKVVGGGYFTNEEQIFLDKYMADRYEHCLLYTSPSPRDER
ncbi:hypothetical protein, partial [Aquitalea sp. ASV11]|uniref:hypothetical protein n=1 Tax=Aquitalea sp. ASV11 TaxID=2795103 RepID=UPI002107B2B8